MYDRRPEAIESDAPVAGVVRQGPHEPAHAQEARLAHAHGGDRVVQVRVEATGHQDHLRPEAANHRHDQPLEHAQVLGVATAGGS